MNKTEKLTEYLEELSNKEIMTGSEYETVFSKEMAEKIIEKLNSISEQTKNLIDSVSQKINLSKDENLSSNETNEIKLKLKNIEEISSTRKTEPFSLIPAMELKTYETHLIEKSESTFNFIDYKERGFGFGLIHNNSSSKSVLGSVPLDPNNLSINDFKSLNSAKEYFISRKDIKQNSSALSRINIIQPVLDFIEKYESLIPEENKIE